MSDLSNQNDHSSKHNDHQSPIKTPKQLVIAVLAAFIIPIISIVLLVQYVTNDKKMSAGSNGFSEESVAARISPVADQGFTLKTESGPKVLQAGGAVYTAVCAACHDSGVAGSPKLGEAGAWSARIAQGYDTLVSNAINGIRGMPAKGGNPDLDDIEVARAVVYMANKAGAAFKEPAATTAAAPAAAPAAPTAEATLATPAAATASAAPTPAIAAAPATTAAAPAKLSADVGKKIYESACLACHGSGVMGAPKLGDKAAWAPRIKQGTEVLHQNAIAGIRMMPPKGGSAASEEEVKAAVDYMTAASK